MSVQFCKVLYINRKINTRIRKTACLATICVLLVVMVVGAIICITQIKRNHKEGLVGSEWENNTSFNSLDEKNGNLTTAVGDQESASTSMGNSESSNITDLREMMKHFISSVNNSNTRSETATGFSDEDQNNSTQTEVNAGVRKLIVPGTKWCGPGSTATSYDDLGTFSGTDKCCRDHDFCPDFMYAGEKKYGLVNKSFFVWSRCDCDEKFYKCLKELQNPTADLIGYGYFTVLGPKCFKNDYVVVGCRKYEYTEFSLKKTNRQRCTSYNFDDSLDKQYQLFDNPIYHNNI